jgi:hypothetical protein
MYLRAVTCATTDPLASTIDLDGVWLIIGRRTVTIRRFMGDFSTVQG